MDDEGPLQDRTPCEQRIDKSHNAPDGILDQATADCVKSKFDAVMEETDARQRAQQKAGDARVIRNELHAAKVMIEQDPREFWKGLGNVRFGLEANTWTALDHPSNNNFSLTGRQPRPDGMPSINRLEALQRPAETHADEQAARAKDRATMARDGGE